MPTELPKVIWESEHAGGTRFRIVRWIPTGLRSVAHTLEMSCPDDVDALGVRRWAEADQCRQAVVEVLLAALLRELPS